MRTDAKVGLICVLALVGGVTAWYAWPAHKAKTTDLTTAEPIDGSAAAPAAPQAGSLTVTGPVAPTPRLAGPQMAMADDLPSATVPAITPFSVPATTGPTSLTTSTPSMTPGVKIEGPAVPASASAPSPFTPTPFTPAPVYARSTPRKPTIDPANSGFSSTPSPAPSPFGSPDMPPSVGTSGTTSTGTPGGTYTIKAGDIFPKIAKEVFGNAKHSTIKAIMDANPGVDPTKLKVGQKINLPTSIPTTGTASSSGSSSVGSTTPPDTGSTTPSTSTKPASAIGDKYTVKKGDTLRKIAKEAYGKESKWKTIAKANSITDPDEIYVGEVLKIPGK